MKVIKNSLQKKDFSFLNKTMTNNFFNWFVTHGVVYNDNHYQFTHNFYSDFQIKSNHFNLLDSILKIINPVSLIKIKANLLPKSNKIIEHGMHVDVINKNSKTAIYYVNTNNGYTKFESNKKIISEENKLIIFNSNIHHTGTTCTDSDYRIVINFNYFENET